MNNLEFAIQMELEGQKYYLEQAEINKDNDLKKVFIILADAEKEHATLLTKRNNQESIELVNTITTPDLKSIFHNLEAFKASEIQSPKQIDAYRLAVTQEEKSIQLYQDLLNQASDQKDKELYEFLIKQEKEHLILFEELVTMLLRLEEWVENAEFGIREEY